MAEYEKKVGEILSKYGCYLIRQGKRDHEIWYSPISQRHITVDGKIKSRFTANAIIKQSGIVTIFNMISRATGKGNTRNSDEMRFRFDC